MRHRKGDYSSFSLMVPRAGTKTAGTTEPIPRQTTKHKTPTQKRYGKEDMQVGHYVRKVCTIYSGRISSLRLGSPYARDPVSYRRRRVYAIEYSCRIKVFILATSFP